MINLPIKTDSFIPQVSIQETFIVEGIDNIIEQTLNQSLVFIPVGIPDFEENEALPVFLQEAFGDTVEQTLEQTLPELEQLDHDENSNDSDNESHETSAEINIDLTMELLEDASLSATQLNLQTVNILGNGNTVIQETEQFITDLFIFEGDDDSDLESLLQSSAEEILLDSLQFALQDVVIEGNDNSVEQTIDQTITAFIFLDEDELESYSGLSQTAIQEVFLGDSDDSVENNTITQDTTQSIDIDLSFSDEFEAVFPSHTTDSSELSSFNIDIFLDEIFSEDIIKEGTQEISQDALITGNNNQVTQEDEQEIIGNLPLLDLDEDLFFDDDHNFIIGNQHRFFGENHPAFGLRRRDAGNHDLDFNVDDDDFFWNWENLGQQAMLRYPTLSSSENHQFFMSSDNHYTFIDSKGTDEYESLDSNLLSE